MRREVRNSSYGSAASARHARSPGGKPKLLSAIACAASLAATATAAPLGTAFTFQGQLQQQGSPANGSFDLKFDMFDVEVGGLPVVAPVLVEDVAVADGLFAVELDFGTAPFTGVQLWLEIAVRPGASSGGYSMLLPRHKLTAHPLALRAETVAAGAVGRDEVDVGEVQLRVSGSCGSGSAIAAIGVDGTPTCESDDDTIYSAGAGLNLAGTTFSVNNLVVQARVSGSCPSGSSIRAIGSSGTVACESDDDTINTNASLLTSGTLSTARYDAYGDLSAAGRLDNSQSSDLLTRAQSDARYVNAGATVTANTFQYDTDPTFSHEVLPTSFVQEAPGAAWRLSADGSFRYCQAGALPGSTESFAEVHLPSFATVTGLVCYFFDASSSGDLLPTTARLYERLALSPAVTLMATAQALTTGSAAAVQSFSDTSISSAGVSANGAYWIRLNYAASYCNTQAIRFYGCRVDYTLYAVGGN